MTAEALGITPPEINHDIDIADQYAEISAQLGRVAGIKNEDLKEQAVQAAADLLDPDNLQTVDGGEVTNNFQLLELLPPLHELDPELAEEKIVELAVDESLIDNQEFIRDFEENLAEVRTHEPLIELPKTKRNLARAEASVELHAQRDVHYSTE